MTAADLCLNAAAVDCLHRLSSVANQREPASLTLPGRTELAELLAELTVPYDAIAATLSLAARLTADQRDFLQVVSAAMLTVMDRAGSLTDARSTAPGQLLVELPELATPSGFGRLGYLLVFAALVPKIRAVHRSLKIPKDVSRTTLADLGRHSFVFGRRYQLPGLDKQQWMTLHFTGRLFQLGRLQFERTTAGDDIAAAAQASGLTVRPGDPVLSVHIPRFLGPLSVADCDASFAAARVFFAEHFPAEHHQVALCTSWLLDPQLAPYLGEQANIVSFQRRFTVAGEPVLDDASALEFTFDRPDLPLDALPQTSRLERAIVRQLTGGGHWQCATGWMRW